MFGIEHAVYKCICLTGMGRKLIYLKSHQHTMPKDINRKG